MEQNFTGFTEDTYKFFWELALRNEIPFFEENRKRYEEVVKTGLFVYEAFIPVYYGFKRKIKGNYSTRNIVTVSFWKTTGNA